MVTNRFRRRVVRGNSVYSPSFRNGVHGAIADDVETPRLEDTEPYRLQFTWRRSFGVLAFLFCAAVMFVNAVDPYSGATASPYYRIAPHVSFEVNAQDLLSTGGGVQSAGRDGVSVEEAALVIPAQGIPDPDSAKAIGYKMVLERGWPASEYDCLALLWDRESHWNMYAENTSSGAYGIPQALPGDKMASVADDWRTNPVTQITWGLGYIEGRYGSPCGAWAHSEEMNWY